MQTLCFCNSNLAWGGGEKWHLEAAFSFAKMGYKVHLFCHPEGALFQRASKYAKAFELASTDAEAFELASTQAEALELASKYAKALDFSPTIAKEDKANLHKGSFIVQGLAVGRFSFINPFIVQKIKSFFAQERVSAVVMNLPADLKAFAPIAKVAGVPQIIFRRGSAIAVKNSFLNRWLYGSVLTGVIANSAQTARLVVQNNPDLLQGKPLHILPNGIDTDVFEQNLIAAQPLSFVEELKKTKAGKPLILGNAGRLNKQKAQHYLLYLGADLNKLGVDFRLVIAGIGEREQELKQLAKTLGLADKVVFCGFLEDLSSFWKSIDVFVLTSLWEGFGYVVLEAMLAKKPVCAFETSNIPELVKDGENGLLFSLPEESRPDLSQMALKIAKLDPEAMQRMGENGYTFAKQNFSNLKCMERLEEIIFPLQAE